MNTKQKILNSVIAIEGGYVNDPSDSGGETNYGVTLKTAREYGYTGDMKEMPVNIAYEIYSDRYWNSIKGDDIDKICPTLAEKMAMAAVHCGVERASIFMQRALNLLNCQQKYYPDLTVDGMIGTKSISALKAFRNIRGVECVRVLISMYDCLLGSFYIDLAELREKDEKFIYGWFLNRILKGN